MRIWKNKRKTLTTDWNYRWKNITLHIGFHTSIKQLEKKGQIAHPKPFQIIHSFVHEYNYNVSSTYNV